MAYLALSNGMVFEGQRIGAKGACMGELLFTTGVAGCMETLSDPCYSGQIVMQTFPLIGNYGCIKEDLESPFSPAGYVVRELCCEPSNFRSQGSLETLLTERGIVGICGVDTREITRIIREEGGVNACICDEIPADFTAIKAMPAEPVVQQEALYPACGETRFRVTLVNYGVKSSLINRLCSLGCAVKAVPCNASAEEILADDPDGIVLSPGPGNPERLAEYSQEIQKLIGKKPVWGIGLGHLLTVLAMGGSVCKSGCGHHGSNQPVKDLSAGRTFMSSQNHVYTADENNLPAAARPLFVNLNDDSCEGLEYPGLHCFTIQFEPDSLPSFTNTSYLFDRFLAMMGGTKDA